MMQTLADALVSDNALRRQTELEILRGIVEEATQLRDNLTLTDEDVEGKDKARWTELQRDILHWSDHLEVQIPLKPMVHPVAKALFTGKHLAVNSTHLKKVYMKFVKTPHSEMVLEMGMPWSWTLEWQLSQLAATADYLDEMIASDQKIASRNAWDSQDLKYEAHFAEVKNRALSPEGFVAAQCNALRENPVKQKFALLLRGDTFKTLMKKRLEARKKGWLDETLYLRTVEEALLKLKENVIPKLEGKEHTILLKSCQTSLKEVRRLISNRMLMQQLDKNLVDAACKSPDNPEIAAAIGKANDDYHAAYTTAMSRRAKLESAILKAYMTYNLTDYDEAVVGYQDMILSLQGQETDKTSPRHLHLELLKLKMDRDDVTLLQVQGRQKLCDSIKLLQREVRKYPNVKVEDELPSKPTLEGLEYLQDLHDEFQADRKEHDTFYDKKSKHGIRKDLLDQHLRCWMGNKTGQQIQRKEDKGPKLQGTKIFQSYKRELYYHITQWKKGGPPLPSCDDIFGSLTQGTTEVNIPSKNLHVSGNPIPLSSSKHSYVLAAHFEGGKNPRDNKDRSKPGEYDTFGRDALFGLYPGHSDKTFFDQHGVASKTHEGALAWVAWPKHVVPLFFDPVVCKAAHARLVAEVKHEEWKVANLVKMKAVVYILNMTGQQRFTGGVLQNARRTNVELTNTQERLNQHAKANALANLSPYDIGLLENACRLETILGTMQEIVNEARANRTKVPATAARLHTMLKILHDRDGALVSTVYLDDKKTRFYNEQSIEPQCYSYRLHDDLPLSKKWHEFFDHADPACPRLENVSLETLPDMMARVLPGRGAGYNELEIRKAIEASYKELRPSDTNPAPSWFSVCVYVHPESFDGPKTHIVWPYAAVYNAYKDEHEINCGVLARFYPDEFRKLLNLAFQWYKAYKGGTDEDPYVGPKDDAFVDRFNDNPNDPVFGLEGIHALDSLFKFRAVDAMDKPQRTQVWWFNDWWLNERVGSLIDDVFPDGQEPQRVQVFWDKYSCEWSPVLTPPGEEHPVVYHWNARLHDWLPCCWGCDGVTTPLVDQIDDFDSDSDPMSDGESACE